jgi:hypothetical protein
VDCRIGLKNSLGGLLEDKLEMEATGSWGNDTDHDSSDPTGSWDNWVWTGAATREHMTSTASYAGRPDMETCSDEYAGNEEGKETNAEKRGTSHNRSKPTTNKGKANQSPKTPLMCQHKQQWNQ